MSLPLFALMGFLLSALSFPPYIHWLKKQQIGQFIRAEGPASHSAKARTPTMGGVCLMASVSIVSIGCPGVLGQGSPELFLVLVFSIMAGLIGLLDDLAKIKRQANAGLSARLRLLLESGLGLALGVALVLQGRCAVLPAHQGDIAISVLATPALFVLIAAFYMAATTNAVNLHDGMDGLAGGTAILVLSSLAFMLFQTGQLQLAALSSIGAGSTAGFMLFNRYPAKIFMGDTGSLFLGGLMACLVVAGHLEIWFIPLALIYIIETLSVMAQVVYFKLTKAYTPDKPLSKPALVWLKLTKRLPGEGKRLLRMAPLHHHFEAVAQERGLKEWQVVACFWLVQLFLCAATLTAFHFACL